MKEDWIECTLGEVCFTTSGGTPSRQNKSFYNGNIPWIKSGELDKGIIYDSEEHISEEAIKKSSAKIFPKGTLLFALYGATIGKMATLGIDAATNQAICGIYKSDAFDSKYLFNNLLFQKNFLIQQGIGGAQPNISQTILKKLNIPIAPLVEQKAIVKKIEELFSSLDSGIADLKKAQDQLVIYRHAVLKKAIEGELTNLKQKNKEIPEGWKRKTIREVCHNIKVGIVIKPTNFYSESKNGIKAFRSANVREFRVNDTNWVYFSEEGNNINKRTQVQTGDVLLVRSGYPGTSCVVREKFNNTNAIDILIATPNQEIILPDFLCAFNNSPLGKGLFSKGSQGVAQKHLNVGVYGKLLISYPNINQQQKILKEIESRLSVCDKVEESIKESLQKAQALRQSILKKAFEGTLLSEVEIAKCKADEDYEPASILLEKIKLEAVNKL